MTIDPVATNQRTSQAYDRWATAYDTKYASPFHDAEDEIVSDLLREIIQPVDRVIDLGCGTGLGLRMLSKPPHRYAGVDISPMMLRMAQARHPQHHFYQSDMTAIGAMERPYDAAICPYGGVSHAAGLRLMDEAGSRLLDELERILKPGGSFVLMFIGVGAAQRPSECLKDTEGLWTTCSYATLVSRFNQRFERVQVRPMSGYVSSLTPGINWTQPAIVNLLRIESAAMVQYGREDDAYWQIVTGKTRGG